MIQSLHIENIAVIKSLDVELSKGFTVLTGQTGAGKSIIIDSLGLLLGGRADRELLRNGETRAEVSAVFSDLSTDVVHTLTDMDFSCEDGTVMISRTLSATGSAAKINGKGVTLSMLREVASLLLNIHGQNDNHSLLDVASHIRFLDSYADCEAEVEAYEAVYRKILHQRAALDCLERDTREQLRLREMLLYQLKEIDAGKLKVGEEEALTALLGKLRNAERIDKAQALTKKALRGGDKGMGAMYLLERASAALEAISDSVPEAEDLATRLRQVGFELEDIADSAEGLFDAGDENPTVKLDRTEGRLDVIAGLKKKYGATVEEVLAYREETAERLARIEHADERREDLLDELAALEKEGGSLADALREKRRAAAEGLRTRITETLEFLDMPKVCFDVRVRPTLDFLPRGRDEVEFLISTNPGEPLMPLNKIASGGELARIMLSLKNVLNHADGVDTMIFDEIDTGISGKTSRKVGIKLREIGEGAQVLCVTHSAQIASLANTHFCISKHEVGGRSETTLIPLYGEARVEEVARILGGIHITEAQRAAAREMIAEGGAQT